MGSTGDESHDDLVTKLTTGFGAMLEQVQELARRNIDLQMRLSRVQEEVSLDPVPFKRDICHEEKT